MVQRSGRAAGADRLSHFSGGLRQIHFAAGS
jgi:hypothetical protein